MNKKIKAKCQKDVKNRNKGKEVATFGCFLSLERLKNSNKLKNENTEVSFISVLNRLCKFVVSK